MSLTLSAAVQQAIASPAASRNEEGLPIHWKATKNFRGIIRTIEHGQSIDRAFILITGPSGVGKTEALKFYARQKDVYYLLLAPDMSHKHLAYAIRDLLGISSGTGWEMQTAVMATKLRESPACVILDEGLRLNFKAYDWLRYLSDLSYNPATGRRTTFVLVDEEHLGGMLRRWSKIDSRIGTRMTVYPMDKEEFWSLYGEVGLSKSVMAEIYRLSQGVISRVDHVLRHFDRAREWVRGQTGEDISPSAFSIKDVQVALEGLGIYAK
jgi:DNA transposition AAA+ family ATPase